MPTQASSSSIKILSPEDIHKYMDGLSEIFEKCVNNGGAIGYVVPTTKIDAQAFWWNTVLPAVQSGERILLVAFDNDLPVGAVQLIKQLPANQPHRCEVAKLMVHPDHRKKGFASELMRALETQAIYLKKSLITLDTKTGDNAERLYGALGFKRAGVIPNYALDPDRKQFHATTYMYKELTNNA